MRFAMQYIARIAALEGLELYHLARISHLSP